MDYRIFPPRQITCEVNLPASKSISNRALILNALSSKSAALSNVAQCNDTDAMVAALQSPGTQTINIGAAGTAMRFLTAFLSTREGQKTALDGSERMRHRPIRILVDALRRCGAKIDYTGEEGFPPLDIEGTRLKADTLEIPGNVSSQYISALLMIAPLIDGLKTVKLTGDVISRPYIDMTLQLMSQFGVTATWNMNTISINSSNGYHAHDFTIENDWSAASYWFELQALLPQSRITLKGLYPTSAQGDAAVAALFTHFGVRTNWCGGYLDLHTNEHPAQGKVVMDLINNPDLAQTLVVTACLLNRPFEMRGLQTLKIKETDRIEALRTELRKLGYEIAVSADYTLSWNGTTTTPDKNICIDTYDDHRMAMAFAPAAIKFPGIVIKDIEVVSKSYPDYWKHLCESGFQIKQEEGNQ